MNDLISRSALLEKAVWVVEYDESGCGFDMKAVPIEDVLKAPAVDAVSREVVEQVMWERDTAIEQLKEHGIPFGGIAPDVVKVCRCKECKHWKCRRMGLTGEVGDCYNDDLPFICESRPVMKAEAFCSCGERRADDAD